MLERRGNIMYKYNYLMAALRNSIYRNEFGEDGKIPTERELSEIHNLSRVTVRAALKELTREGLIERHQGRGTYVRQGRKQEAISAPAEKTVFRVLFLASIHKFPVEVDPYFGQVFLGFHQAKSSRYEYDICRRDIHLETGLIPNIQDADRYDGLIIPHSILKTSDIEYLEKRRIHFVSMGHPESYLSVPKIDVDNFYGIYISTEHLLAKGYRKILLFYYKESRPLRQMVLDAYYAALDKYGLSPAQELIHEMPYTCSETAEEKIDELLEAGVPFDSVLVLGDWATLGTMNALKRHGLKIPEDVGLVYYDAYQWLLEGIRPRPTYVVQPFARMAEKALDILSSLSGEKPGVIPQVLVKPELYQGQTT